MEVNASVGKTWDQVIDQFANSNIPIATLERSSGFIATKELNPNVDHTFYNCGKISDPDYKGGFRQFVATQVSYNVRVLGDSSHSTVKVTAAYVDVLPGNASQRMAAARIDCSSTGKFETEIEKAIKDGAESRK
jgi:hypothetical protein